MEKIKIGICGYGNLGKGIENEINKSLDMELVAVFTKREPDKLTINSSAKVVNVTEIAKWKDKIDVMIMCGGSATDLPIQVPEFAKFFNTVDSFDTHKKIPEYFETVDKVAKENNHVSIISIGWDPGLFSLMRLYSNSILQDGSTYTFWGKGVSQGHSDAIRRIAGVKNAVQYTIPNDEAIKKVRAGEAPTLTTREKHFRECFVVLEDGANKEEIEKQIKEMPNYFDEYDTTVHFIFEEELKENHNRLPHGGFVIHSGNTGDNNSHVMEFSLKLDSNPEFTSSVLIAYARANYRLQKLKDYGAKTIFDIPPKMLSNESDDELRKKLL
jgi:diaminopimelate dehydrogenase